MSPLAETAALFADRTRAAFCLALLDGRAWTAGELARHAGVRPSTASEQLSRLVESGLLAEERQGRHRYVRLAGPDAAALIEALASYGSATPRPGSLRASGRLSAEARARTCYDHLAGRLGVTLADATIARGLVSTDGGLAVTPAGRAWLADALGFERPPGTRRPLVRSCLDWTERRPHLAGTLGAALCETALERRWVRRVGSGRAVKVTPEGAEAFRELLGAEVTPPARE
ncbi:transcriptional regulator [Streptomyces cinnamoneus]|uniref:Transcriptional regulator n=1 Tax=Streptomyces cinnamoneus TaxID=53446 RepID=A0A2G1XM45_STRCJ|nr:helix-turn-helix domain-containing protein [Streptomyces cinnamoneus]PHQ51383.1 transcriptional regulator [Streptomyces cinnamoneus]PHQ52293.1 transcriptional regulator [Streptomyces cinnamoneus]PPT11723.1 transcriptional regulator [Streptomyces cinnamoneus]